MKRIDQLLALGVPRSQAKAFDVQRPASRINVKSEAGVGEILLYGEIGFDWWSGEGTTASSFAESLQQLGDVSKVVVKINSPGGDVWDGLTIHNQLAQLEVPVEVRIEGIAASAASIVAIAGDSVLMAKASQMMIHNAWTMVAGNASGLREVADLLDKVDGQLADLYASKGGKDRAEYLTAMASDTYMVPDEAIAMGLADGIIEPPQKATKASAGETPVRNRTKLFTLRTRLAI